MSTQDSLQLLFPSINFTESQNITAWSFVATQNNDPAIEDKFPQLQVWRLALVSNSYSLVTAVGDNSILQGTGRLYRYVLSTPIPVSPGDALGIYIPRFPKLFLRFRNVGVGNTTTYYFTTANIPQSYIATTAYTPGSQWIPFVAVQFGERSCCNLLMYILLHARSLYSFTIDHAVYHCNLFNHCSQLYCSDSIIHSCDSIHVHSCSTQHIFSIIHSCDSIHVHSCSTQHIFSIIHSCDSIHVHSCSTQHIFSIIHSCDSIHVHSCSTQHIFSIIHSCDSIHVHSCSTQHIFSIIHSCDSIHVHSCSTQHIFSIIHSCDSIHVHSCSTQHIFSIIHSCDSIHVHSCSTQHIFSIIHSCDSIHVHSCSTQHIFSSII